MNNYVPPNVFSSHTIEESICQIPQVVKKARKLGLCATGAAFASHPDWVENAIRLVERIEEYSPCDAPSLPDFPLPEDISSAIDELRRQVYGGAAKRWGEPLPEEARKRIEYELDSVAYADCRFDIGVARYLLIVNDYVKAAHDMGLWTSSGYAYSAGSAICYALGITQADPVKYGLLSERFMTRNRIMLPDIDICLEPRGRNKIIKYLIAKYGLDHVAQAAGAVRFDFLELEDIGRQKRCVELVKERYGVAIDIERIPEDDAASFSVFSHGDTDDIHDFKSEGMKQLLKEMKPSSLSDLAALYALYRPSMQELIPEFIRAKFGGGGASEYCSHPLAAEILGETYGVIAYQEQIMLLAQKLAGFMPEESNKLRIALGKRLLDVIMELKPKFIGGCLANSSFCIGDYADVAKAVNLAESLWSECEKAGRHAFMKCHAICVALTAYRSAYLKGNWGEVWN